jgi:hypothetical protein
MRGRTIALALLTVLITACDEDPQPAEIVNDEAIGIRYGILSAQGEPDPRRVIVLLSTDARSTLDSDPGRTKIMQKLVPRLKRAGFTLLSLDLPCTGADLSGNDATQVLGCWRDRIEFGESDMFVRFCEKLSAVLDKLGVAEAGLVGESRGAYLAATCAGYDARMHRLVLLKPVTDLQVLLEFGGYTVDQQLLGLGQYQAALRGRPILMRIGPRDDRVDTSSAIAFAQSIGAEIQLVECEGHELPEDGTTVRWLQAHW